MPPKGWRKDAQGNYPTTSYMKEQENVTIQDLLFPRSVIIGLAKHCLEEEGVVPEDGSKTVIINKDAGLAMQRSATVFVNHLLMFAREIAKDQDKKSCNAEDVLNALSIIGHGGLKPIVREKLDEYQAIFQERKLLRQQLQGSAKSEDKNDAGSSNEEELQDVKRVNTGMGNGAASVQDVEVIDINMNNDRASIDMSNSEAQVEDIPMQ